MFSFHVQGAGKTLFYSWCRSITLSVIAGISLTLLSSCCLGTKDHRLSSDSAQTQDIKLLRKISEQVHRKIGNQEIMLSRWNHYQIREPRKRFLHGNVEYLWEKTPNLWMWLGLGFWVITSSYQPVLVSWLKITSQQQGRANLQLLQKSSVSHLAGVLWAAKRLQVLCQRRWVHEGLAWQVAKS